MEGMILVFLSDPLISIERFPTLEMPGSIKEHVWSYPLGGEPTRQERTEHGRRGNPKSDGRCSAFQILLIPVWRPQWKTSVGKCRVWQAVGSARALAPARLNEKPRPPTMLLTQAARDVVERRSLPNHHRRGTRS